MTGVERPDAFAILRSAYDDEAKLGDTLALFVERPDYGFLWLAYDDDVPVGCVNVAFAISIDAGGIVAELRDLYVVPERRRRGIAGSMLEMLRERLERLDVVRIDATLGPGDAAATAAFAAMGYRGRDATHVSRRR